MKKELSLQEIQSVIIQLPNRPAFMLAQDLAQIYETETKYINRAVERNKQRFPTDFCFQLTLEEVEIIKENWYQSGSKIYAGAKKLPYGFTREGANMLSMVLQTEFAVERSVQIMRAFSLLDQLPAKIPSFYQGNHELAQMANQLTENARQLASNAENLAYQGEILKAAVGEMYRNKENIRKNQDDITTLHKRVRELERQGQHNEVKKIKASKESPYITSEQMELLKSRVKKLKEHPVTIWKKFNKAFDISRYKFLPQERFEEAIAWLDNYENQ